MCTHKQRLVLVSLLIGWKNGARTSNQSVSGVMQNQSNLLITFDTQLKTALFCVCVVLGVGVTLWLPWPNRNVMHKVLRLACILVCAWGHLQGQWNTIDETREHNNNTCWKSQLAGGKPVGYLQFQPRSWTSYYQEQIQQVVRTGLEPGISGSQGLNHWYRALPADQDIR